MGCVCFAMQKYITFFFFNFVFIFAANFAGRSTPTETSDKLKYVKLLKSIQCQSI